MMMRQGARQRECRRAFPLSVAYQPRAVLQTDAPVFSQSFSKEARAMPSNQVRVQAIQDITRKTLAPKKPSESLESLWASDVFTLAKMKEQLPKDVFKSLKKTIELGTTLDVSVADVVATAMKAWASAKGALYYAHVFYPLTNATAEKHDGFISVQSDGSVISEFGGKVLVQGEPDGSS